MIEKFIKLSKQERKNLITKVESELDLGFDVVEKDLWVCFVLDQLFSAPELQGKLVFKGGTSLSKSYNLIERFSEDVDITIDKDCFSPIAQSNNLNTAASKIRKACDQFVKDEIYKILNKIFDKELQNENWNLTIDSDDKSTLLFEFPISDDGKRFLSTNNEDRIVTRDGSNIMVNLGHYNYIKPSIKLEFGARGEVWPFETRIIEPYAAKILPAFFKSTKVITLDAKRTFIEKLIILHFIHDRPNDKKLAGNYSRHYYDVYCLITARIGDEAIKLLDILVSVIKNSRASFGAPSEACDKIKDFSDLRLSPPNQRIKELEDDYAKMKGMFFKHPPKFSEIIKSIEDFEKVLKS